MLEKVSVFTGENLDGELIFAFRPIQALIQDVTGQWYRRRTDIEIPVIEYSSNVRALFQLSNGEWIEIRNIVGEVAIKGNTEYPESVMYELNEPL